MKPLLAIACLASVIGTLGVKAQEDAIFVQTTTAGVADAQRGEVVELTPHYLVLRTRGAERLFTRESVRRIVLEVKRFKRNDAICKYIVGQYWNTELPPIVKAAQALPFVGQPLHALDYIPPSLASTLASIALCIVVAWGCYKAYELMVVSRETNRLAKLRLQLEIAKLRHEALEISRRLDLPDAQVLASLELPLPEPPTSEPPPEPTSTAMPRALVAPFMSSTGRAEQRELYIAEALVYIKRGARHVRDKLLRRSLGLLAITVIIAFYGIGLAFATIGGIAEAVESHAANDISLAVLFGVLALILLRQSIRNVIKMRDIKHAFRTVLASAAASTIVSNADGPEPVRPNSR